MSAKSDSLTLRPPAAAATASTATAADADASSSSTHAAVPAPPPQRGDWERHKRRIAQLYLEDNKPLREVADLMRIEHDFYATPKMYKQRFHQWDFRKNLKAGEVQRFKGLTAAGQETHLPVVHGRKLGSKRLKSLVVKSNRTLSSSPPAMGGSRHTTPMTPIPGPIDVPEDLRLVEVSLQAVTSYSQAQLSSGTWDLRCYRYEQTGTQYWSVGMGLAALQIEEKRDLAANFQVLNKCCDEYAVILRRQDPLLIWVTYNAVLQLSRAGPDLAKSFVKLAAGLSMIHFGRSHPLTLLWTSLRRMNVQEIRRAALPIIDAQFELFRHGAPNDEFWSCNVINLIKKFHDMGLLSPEETHKRLKDCIDWIQQNPGSDVKAFEARLNSVRLFVVCVLVDHMEYAKADNILHDVEVWMEGDGEPKDHQRVNCAEIRADLDLRLGKPESAEYHYKKGLRLAQELLWRTDPGRIGFSFTALENFYVDEGRVAAAQAVRQGYNEHLKSMVGELTPEPECMLQEIKAEDGLSDTDDSDTD